MIPHPINQIRDANAHREALIAEAIRERRSSRASASPSRQGSGLGIEFPAPMLMPAVADLCNALKRLRLPRWGGKVSTP